MAVTTPTGYRMPRMIRSRPAESVSLGSCSPVIRFASSNAVSSNPTVRSTSPRLFFSDMPDSMVIPSAISSFAP